MPLINTTRNLKELSKNVVTQSSHISEPHGYEHRNHQSAHLVLAGGFEEKQWRQLRAGTLTLYLSPLLGHLKNLGQNISKLYVGEEDAEDKDCRVEIMREGEYPQQGWVLDYRGRKQVMGIWRFGQRGSQVTASCTTVLIYQKVRFCGDHESRQLHVLGKKLKAKILSCYAISTVC